ncbi:MAG: S1/P1 nuclease [Burkholderiaceae bacterium]
MRQRVFALLATDSDPLTARDFISETTWDDRHRDSDRDRTRLHFLHTRQWHFVDIDLAHADIDKACFGHPPVPPGAPASHGVAADCAVDKIDEFVAELRSPSTTAVERLLALEFLMHFVGDIHQPQNSSDDNDSGGKAKNVTAAGLRSVTLHGFWDTQFVIRLANNPILVGDTLAAKITPAQVTAWSSGTPASWSIEAFQVATTQAYGKLPEPGASRTYALSTAYVKASTPVVSMQLSRAGVRLATLLNRAFAAT